MLHQFLASLFFLSVVYTIPLDDACLFSPCHSAQICVPEPNFKFKCVNEMIQKTSFRLPMNVLRHDAYDPCITSPCRFGTVCKSLPDNNYICLKELEISPAVTYARQIYQDMERRYSKAIGENIEKISYGQENMYLLKGKKDPKKNPCDNSPCEIGYTCQLDEQAEDGFSCIEQLSDMQIMRETSKTKELLKDKDYVRNMTLECSKQELFDRVTNPKNPNQFIVCLEDGEFTIMDCPDNLVFNQYLDRCDYTTDSVNVGCESSPCLFGAKCLDLEDKEFKCECPEGFSGKTCERTPDFCASKPCGPQGVCHSLPYDSPVPYYCTCFNNQAFGVNCDEESEKNPCLDDESEHESFKTELDDSIYIHCNKYSMHLKYCPKPLVFSQEHQACEWVDLKQRRKVDKI